jgi:hypothetical protein
MDLNIICKKIKKIYTQIEQTIDQTNLVQNHSHDQIAINLFEEFVIELVGYKNNLTNSTDLEAFVNHLNSKYLASKLDQLDSTYQVKLIRKTICKVLDKLVK